MRILFSAIQYPTKKHPFAAFIAMMAEEMAERGHDVTLVAPQSITHSIIRGTTILPYCELVKKDSFKFPIKVYRPKTFTFGEGRIKGKFTIFLLQKAVTFCLKRIKNNFDIAYSHFWQSAYNVLEYIREKKIPLVVVSGEDVINLNKHLSTKQLHDLNDLSSNLIEKRLYK